MKKFSNNPHLLLFFKQIQRAIIHNKHHKYNYIIKPKNRYLNQIIKLVLIQLKMVINSISGRYNKHPLSVQKHNIIQKIHNQPHCHLAFLMNFWEFHNCVMKNLSASNSPPFYLLPPFVNLI